MDIKEEELKKIHDDLKDHNAARRPYHKGVAEIICLNSRVYDEVFEEIRSFKNSVFKDKDAEIHLDWLKRIESILNSFGSQLRDIIGISPVDPEE